MQADGDSYCSYKFKGFEPLWQICSVCQSWLVPTKRSERLWQSLLHGRRYKEKPCTNAGEIVAREVAAVIWWPVLKGSWFLSAFLLSQRETGGSTSIISASFCSLAFSVNTAKRIHLFLPSIVNPYVNKLFLSVRVPVVSFADLLFSIYLKHFL